VLEELKKQNKEWGSFLASAGITANIFGNPQDKEDTPSLVEIKTILSPKSSSKRKENKSRDQDIGNKRKRDCRTSSKQANQK